MNDDDAIKYMERIGNLFLIVCGTADCRRVRAQFGTIEDARKYTADWSDDFPVIYRRVADGWTRTA